MRDPWWVYGKQKRLFHTGKSDWRALWGTLLPGFSEKTLTRKHPVLSYREEEEIGILHLPPDSHNGTGCFAVDKKLSIASHYQALRWEPRRGKPHVAGWQLGAYVPLMYKTIYFYMGVRMRPTFGLQRYFVKCISLAKPSQHPDGTFWSGLVWSRQIVQLGGPLKLPNVQGKSFKIVLRETVKPEKFTVFNGEASKCATFKLKHLFH